MTVCPNCKQAPKVGSYCLDCQRAYYREYRRYRRHISAKERESIRQSGKRRDAREKQVRAQIQAERREWIDQILARFQSLGYSRNKIARIAGISTGNIYQLETRGYIKATTEIRLTNALLAILDGRDPR